MHKLSQGTLSLCSYIIAHPKRQKRVEALNVSKNKVLRWHSFVSPLVSNILVPTFSKLVQNIFRATIKQFVMNLRWGLSKVKKTRGRKTGAGEMIIRSGQACFGGAQSINWVAALHEEEDLGG